MKSKHNVLIFIPSLIGALVLFGWLLDIEILKRPRDTMVAMNPMSAVSFVFIGLALYLNLNHSDLNKSRIAIRLIALFVLSIGLTKLYSIISGFDLGMDKVLFSDKIAKDIIKGIPNRMAPNTAFDFVVLGFAVFLSSYRKEVLSSISNYLCILVLLIGLFSVIGYVYQVQEFYGILSYIPMAIHTAISFIFCSFALLLINGHFGFMRVFTSKSSGGILARVLIPFLIIVPVLFGYIRIYLNRLNPVSLELGVGFLMTGIILTFFILVWFVATQLEKSDIARTDAERKLSELNHELEILVSSKTMDLFKSENRFRTILEQFPYPVLTYDPQGVCTGTNFAWEEMWNTRRDVLVDYNILKDPQIKEAGFFPFVEKAFGGEPAISEPFPYDPKLIGSSGRNRWLQMVLYPVKNTAGNILEVIVVHQDITASKEAENEIRLLNNELEERVKVRTEQLVLANKELESFSYSISHDLRAPIRGISGFTQILMEDYGVNFDAEGKRIIGKIIENAKQMGQLVDDLLEFSRLGRTELAEREISMKELATTVYKELINLESGREIRFEIKDIPNVRADQPAVRQLWVNLISNAIKYTKKAEAPLIQIGFIESKEGTVFYVKDNGAGFNMQYYHKLFGVFQRLHSNADFEGTGVGLAIVKRIASRHGGNVWAESKEGEGATFYFTLPGQDSKLK
ncbi:sensor histidine kinase [Leptospira haakeii]|uniref:histidine kinase n=1 Tax=Leptospira haakeii TaxID=2023198 RepID=A0ABX4PJZ7_9LEPT|nr:ATP-binding protein [Leptospira haakeii]PKA16101.1 PAS domain-containing sensor histidine kinase [Leptospira haakeii]PKA19112.1 PAS domain-containing sensor histidine kinase [Leptospira haakeii]